MFELNLITNQWKEIKFKNLPPSPRFCQTCVFIQKKEIMYLFGGYNSKICMNDLYLFDRKTCLWKFIQTTNLPSPRYGHSFLLSYDESKIYLFGGYTGEKYVNTLEYIDLKTYEWKKDEMRGIIPSPRTLQLVIPNSNGDWYVFGGKFFFLNNFILGYATKVLGDFYLLKFFENSSISKTFSLLKNKQLVDCQFVFY